MQSLSSVLGDMIGSIAVAAAEDGSDDDTEDPMPVPIGQSLARGLPVSRRPSKIRLKCHYNQVLPPTHFRIFTTTR